MGYVSLGQEKLHYEKWGSGRKLLLAFHGYGNEAGIFHPFAQYLGGEYTILSFDLPHHGGSKWTEDVRFTKKALVALIHAVTDEYQVAQVSLLGYSMGGRVCLTIIEQLPKLVDRVVLIATDGLAPNIYYYFLTHTFIGRNLFHYYLTRPKKLFWLVDLLRDKNLLNSYRYKFVMNYMGHDNTRKFLMQVWPGMSELVPSQSRVKKIIKKHHTNISLFMGEYDEVMPPARAEKFKTGMDSVQLFILNKGHRVFDSDNIHIIAERLL